ncbi:MAG: cytochrome c biogenesis protein ResB, partial [Gemmataceae bacterium]
MDNTLQTNGPLEAARPRGAYPAWKRLLRPLASLRLTVVLFVLSLILVFYGTLAQKEQDVWDVVNEYFWSWWVLIPNKLTLLFLQVFFNASPDAQWSLGFWFPGGKLLFWALLLNLLAAHLVRFQFSWARSGIFLIHGGLVMMMAGEFVTREFAEENVMTLVQGGKASFVESTRFNELAFTRSRADGQVDSVVIPQEMLAAAARSGEVLENDVLPCRVKVLQYASNCDLLEKFPADFENPATEGEGKTLALKEMPPVSGVDPEQRVNMPGAYVQLLDKSNGQPVGTWLVSTLFQLTRPIRVQEVKVGEGGAWKVALRNRRSYRPYTITLEKFTHDVYPGTNTPLNFQSDVHLEDPALGIDRMSVIKLNAPMPHAGETAHQHQALAGDSGSVL